MTRHPIFLIGWIILSMLAAFRLHAQEYHFDQFAKGEKIGVLDVERTEQGDRSVIRFRSEIEVSLILTVHVLYRQKVVLENGILTKARITVRKNGKPDKQVITRRQDGKYLVELDGKSSIVHRDSIGFPAVMLYLEEPEGIEEVFSTYYGDFNPIRKASDEYHLSVDDKGNQNTYVYQEGKLIRAKLHHWLTDIELKRLEQ